MLPGTAAIASLSMPAEERVYLYPGALCFADRPTVVTTVLGSCISVCLWSPTHAGINHYILPRGGSKPSPRYANHALPLLLDGLIARGVSPSELVASVFGGASVMDTVDGGIHSGEATLGHRNLIAAREFLRQHEIPVIREDVGGFTGRKLTFRTTDGVTSVRKL